MDWAKALIGFLVGFILLGDILYGIVTTSIPGVSITLQNFKILVGLLVGYYAGQKRD